MASTLDSLGREWSSKFSGGNSTVNYTTDARVRGPHEHGQQRYYRGELVFVGLLSWSWSVFVCTLDSCFFRGQKSHLIQPRLEGSVEYKGRRMTLLIPQFNSNNSIYNVIRMQFSSKFSLADSQDSRICELPRYSSSTDRNGRNDLLYTALSPVNDSPIAGPSRLPALDLISRPWKPRVKEPSSDFDYEAALKSDVLDTTIRHIAYGTNDPIDVPMYNPDDDILASDPYTPS